VSTGRQGVRFALIGCGVIGRLHARVISSLVPRASLVLAVDLELASAEKLAAQYGAEASTSFGATLERGDVDALAICTPSGSHAELVVGALEAGKSVVVEKPLDIELGAARRALEAQGRTGLTATVISQHRFDRSSQLVHRAVELSRFGQLTSATLTTAWWRSEEYYSGVAWRGTRAMDGGGALLNQAVHGVDLLLWMVGEPKEVFAFTGSLAHAGIEVEDTAVAAVRFANGALGVIHATTAAFPGVSSRLAVHGDKGSAVIEDDNLVYFYASEPGGPPVPDYGLSGSGDAGNQAAVVLAQDGFAGDPAAGSGRGPASRAHFKQYEDFLDAYSRGRPPSVRLSDGERALAVVLAIYESASTGRPVQLS